MLRHYFQSLISDHSVKGIAQRGYKAEQACIAWYEEDIRLYVMLQAKDASSGEYRSLDNASRKVFDKARHAEIQGLFNLGAYRLLSLEESLRFRELYPEYVLPGRWVDRWKGTDEGGVVAKSRIVILGFQDPHVLELKRSAPTPTNEAFTSTMQFFA